MNEELLNQILLLQAIQGGRGGGISDDVLGAMLGQQQAANNPFNPAFLTNAGGIGGQLQGAMGQIGSTLQGNANRLQANRELERDIMVERLRSEGRVAEANALANGQISVADIQARGAIDLVNSPGYQTQFQAPIDIARINADSQLAQERERTNRATSIFGSLGGLLGGMFGGGGGIGSSAPRLTGFASTDGTQSAMMPQPQAQLPQSQIPATPPSPQAALAGGAAAPATTATAPAVSPDLGSRYGQATIGADGVRGLVEHLRRIGARTPNGQLVPDPWMMARMG